MIDIITHGIGIYHSATGADEAQVNLAARPYGEEGRRVLAGRQRRRKLLALTLGKQTALGEQNIPIGNLSLEDVVIEQLELAQICK